MDDRTASSVNGISTGPVASTSTAGLQQSTEQLLETSSQAGRAKRSRRDRPCDTCRRQKHMCVIAIKGQPCRACAARSRPCTFLDPPTARVRKPKTDGDATGTGTSSPRLPEGTLPTQADFAQPASRPSSSTAVLSQIRAALLPPPLPPGSTSDELLSSTNGAAELNYVNSHAFSSQSFSKEQFHSSGWPGDVAFRQVSSDDAFPVHFVQVPTLMYGTAAPESSRVWQGACAALAPDAPPRLIEIYLKRSQPANPILDETKFTTSDPASLAEAGVSYGLLTSLLAHSTCYVHEIRPVHKYLWRQVLLCLEDEYRRPSLYTMQLALVTITARPAINVAQTHISLGRLVAAAHLLGLHLDPSKWRLPYSERVLRKRLWWSILQQDKWRALWYGRPSITAREDWNVPLPTVEELPPGSSRVQQLSMHSFVAMCRLTEIVDTILSSFLTVRALSSSRSSTETLKLLEKISLELVALENDLPTELHRLPTAEDRPEVTVATGIRSFQLCKLGIDLTLYQLSSTSVQPTTTADSLASCRTALTLAQTLVEFLENLASGDLEMWWAPYCSFIIATAASVLLRTALSAKDLDATTRTAAGVFFARLVVTLTSSHHASHWDVASLALDKIATLLRSLNGALPELVPLLQLFGPPNHANAGPPAPPQPPPPPPVPISPSLTQLSPALPHPFLPSLNQHAPTPQTSALTDQLTSPMSDVDPLWWMHTSVLSLPQHLGALPDLFEGWPSIDGFGQDAFVGGGEAADGAVEGDGAMFDLRSFLEGPSSGDL
ncbi:RHTO0S02e01596g1_1 [Rhodotorula toruloides]|uniref:RHTO0S02e01596g1_1 n=1 Tax=Rhodotorula toruloides TaxID=5286 RepID=A0A061AGZ8_RHOTO|nr:RHTO0S02e01596g1_1 [Rhodotorula toruloides]